MEPQPRNSPQTLNPSKGRGHLGAGDLPDTDDVVGVAGEEGGAISGPGEGDGLRGLGVLAEVGELGGELADGRLALEVPDADSGGSGSAEPVPVGGEDKGVDDIAGLEGVEMLGLVEIPKHDDAVLATGGAQGTIGGNGDGVDVTVVADVVGAELALVELPDLGRRGWKKKG